MAGKMVTFPINGREGSGYIATPPLGSGPGLLVIQEWWGFVDRIRELVDRFAAQGFVAFAPDLYHGKTTPPWWKLGTLGRPQACSAAPPAPMATTP